MIITSEYADIPVSSGSMRTFVAAPKAEGNYPGSVLFRHLSAHAAYAAHLCKAGRVWIRCRGSGNLLPHRTAGNSDAIR